MTDTGGREMMEKLRGRIVEKEEETETDLEALIKEEEGL